MHADNTPRECISSPLVIACINKNLGRPLRKILSLSLSRYWNTSGARRRRSPGRPTFFFHTTHSCACARRVLCSAAALAVNHPRFLFPLSPPPPSSGSSWCRFFYSAPSDARLRRRRRGYGSSCGIGSSRCAQSASAGSRSNFPSRLALIDAGWIRVRNNHSFRVIRICCVRSGLSLD